MPYYPTDIEKRRRMGGFGGKVGHCMDAMSKYLGNLPRVFNVYVMELVIRAALLGAGLAAYFYMPEALDVHKQFGFDAGITLVNIMWLIIFITIVQKFFPQAATSLGSRKQFKAFFHTRPVEKLLGEDLANLSDEVLDTDFFKGNEQYEVLLEEKRSQNRGALLVLIAWGVLNVVLGILYFTHVLDERALVIASMFYLLSDMICVLFYCPFQRLFMKNRCCVTCRIFNWGDMMICTPLLFIPGWFSWTLCALSLAVLVRWELNFNRHPERFSERFNLSLRCAGCEEKLCRIKESK